MYRKPHNVQSTTCSGKVGHTTLRDSACTIQSCGNKSAAAAGPASMAALVKTATVSPQTGQDEAAHANICCVVTDILFGLNTFNSSNNIFTFIKAIN